MTGEGYGAGLLEDLNAVQTILVDHLKNVRTEIFNGLAFKVYLDYECFLSRGPYTTEGGQVAGQDEERVSKLSSADKDHVVFTVRTIDQCTDAIGRSLSTIVELFNDIAVQGSGWIWNRSVGMDINVSKKYDRVPIKGPTSDRMIEKIEAQNRGKDAEKKEAEENPVSQGDPTHAGNHLSLPKWLRDAKKEDCFFNPKPYTHKQEDDNLCFSWCILRALHPDGVKDPSTNQFYPGLLRSGNNAQTLSRMGQGQMGNVADLAEGIRQGKISHIRLPEGVSYPVPLKEAVFAQVEELNGISLSIFLIGFKKNEFFPYYASRCMQEGKPHVRLGILQAPLPLRQLHPNGEASVVGILNGENRNSHFVLVTSLPKLLGSVTSVKRRQKSRVIKLKEPGHKEETLYYDNYLNQFSSVHGSQGLLDHQLACLHDRPTKFNLP